MRVTECVHERLRLRQREREIACVSVYVHVFLRDKERKRKVFMSDIEKKIREIKFDKDIVDQLCFLNLF